MAFYFFIFKKYTMNGSFKYLTNETSRTARNIDVFKLYIDWHWVQVEESVSRDIFQRLCEEI